MTLAPTDLLARCFRCTLLFLSTLGVLLGQESLLSSPMPSLIELQRGLSPKTPGSRSLSRDLLPDLISSQLEEALQDLVEKKKEGDGEKPTRDAEMKESTPTERLPKESEILSHSKALEELEAHLLKLDGLKDAQKATLLSLVQTLDERPDDAFITLKGLKVQGEPEPWLRLQELYLSQSLGLEEDRRRLGEKLRGVWFPERLNISKVEFCRSVKTFGNYEPMGDLLQSGGYTLIYIELTGLTQEVETDGFKRNYQVSFDVHSEAEGSGLSQPPQSFEDFSRSRRDETYVWIKWKAMLTRGPYRMVVKVEDTISGQSLKLDKSFSIR